MIETTAPCSAVTSSPPRPPLLRSRRGRPRRPVPAEPSPARVPVSALHAAEQFALASEIADELLAADDETRAGRHVILPALGAIGIRDPRAVAASVARDALNRTAELCADLPDDLADAVLEDVVRTARLIDTAVTR